MRAAIQRINGRRWTAQTVFTAKNPTAIKLAIERDYPDIKAAQKGYFKHYPEYKTKLFKALSQEYVDCYAKVAELWNAVGASPEVKAA